MKLAVNRFQFTDLSTIGRFYVDGKANCYTLEPKDRHLESLANPEDFKIPDKTAIPRGIYKVDRRMSPHLGKVVPWLLDVPNFTYVYIHWGNKPADTDACILVGDSYTDNWVSDSRATWEKLDMQIEAALDAGDDVTIEVK